MSDLLERDGELDRMHALLDDARAGRGRVAFVAGEAGIGKSALLAELAAEASGFRIAIGRCDALATPRPLGPFVDTAAVLGIEEARDRDQLLGRLIAELGDATPTLLMIEDAHWADQATVELIGMLGRRADDLPLLLVVTYRDGEVGSSHPLRTVIGDLVTASTTAWIGLLPLTQDAVAVLVSDTTLDASELHARTGGNPFFVTEALAAPSDDLPGSVRLAVLARASRLDPTARSVLDAVAVVPGRAERTLVDALCDPDPGAVDACVAAGMLIADGDALAFRHELARLAVWSEMAESTRRQLHARAVSALSATAGVDPARVVHHAAATGDEAAVAHWSVAACRAATARTAYRQAVTHGDQALSVSAHLTDDELADVRVVMARALIGIAEADRAERLAAHAVEHWYRVGDRRREADALVVLSSALAAAGRTEASVAPVARAIELLEQEPPGLELANAYIRMTSIHMLAREHDEAVVWGHKAIELATRLDDPTALGRALIETGTADVMDGRLAGLELVHRAIELGRRYQLPGLVAGGLLQVGSGCGEMRRYDLAVPALEEGIAVAAAHNIESSLRYQLAWLGRCRFDLGEWEPAEASAREGLSGGMWIIARFVSLNTLGWLRGRRGDDDPWPMLDEATAIAHQIAHLQRLWPNAVARAETGWLQGSIDVHVPMLLEVLELARRCRHSIAIGEIGLWLWRAGFIEAAPDGAAEPFASWVGGDPARASAAFAAMGCPYEAASALADTGDTASLREALTTFERLGAVPMSRRVASELASRGVTVGGVAARPTIESHASGLTPRELEVLRLVAAGFSNPQIATALFISRKTAEHHVSNILTKLGLSTRAEAAAAAVRLGVLDD